MLLKRSIVGLVCLFAAVPLLIADDGSESAHGTPVWVTSISQIGDSDQFAAGTANGLLLRESTVMSFDVSDMTALSPLYDHPAAVWCVDSTSDGKTLASVDYRGNLVIYDVANKKPTTHEKAFERWCQALVISPDDKHVLAGNEAGKLMIWDLDAGKVSKSIELDTHAITGLALSPNAKHVAASDGAGHVHLLKWPSLEDVGKIEVCEETVWCVAFSNDGSKIFAGSSDRNLYRADAKPGAKPESVAKGKDWITRIAISASGQVAASEVGGRLHFPSLGGTDSMESKSGVWALCWNGNEQLIAGTRKDGLVAAGRSWKWTEVKKPEPEPDPDAKEEVEEEESKPEMKEEAAVTKEKPKEENAAEGKKEVEAKPAKESVETKEKKEAGTKGAKRKADAKKAKVDADANKKDAK